MGRALLVVLALSGPLACGRDEAPAQGGASLASVGATTPADATATREAPPSARPEDRPLPAAIATEPVVLTELPALCRDACDNALAVTLAELPTNASADMRRELERAVARDCAGRCLQRASAESARCVARAKTALELAACP